MENSKRVCILGASGMLGSAILDVFAQDDTLDLALAATVRDTLYTESLLKKYPDVSVLTFDAENANLEEMVTALEGFDYIINAIGIIKPYIHDNEPTETERAIRVNSLFPHILARAAKEIDALVLQIATDCVYSGVKGDYTESDSHDALDVYGKSKSTGEVPAANVRHLRCSIIGPEPKAHVSLLDWFLGQPENATVNGYTNHHWNGVTTVHFGKLCLGIIKHNVALPQVQHIIPTSKITKSDLLIAFAKAYNREDITVNPVEAEKVIDRTLATNQPETNAEVWKAAGYDTIPTVEDMVKEMAAYTFAK